MKSAQQRNRGMAKSARRYVASELNYQLEMVRAEEGEHVFAILDAARIVGLSVLLNKLQIPNVCLYSGKAQHDLAHVAPYLAQFTVRDDALNWLEQDVDSLETALIIVCDVDIGELRNHLKRFLLVYDADHREVYFRFYDPRVIRPFLRVCNVDEKRQFFGPIQVFLALDQSNKPDVTRHTWHRWPAPEPLADVSTDVAARRPSALKKFTLRPAHMDAFQQYTMESYERRAALYLKNQLPDHLRHASVREIRSKVRRAQIIGNELNITSGQDVTLLAEAMILGGEDQALTLLKSYPAADRSNRLQVLRDQLITTGEA